jgi:hypothetical protein
MIIGSIRVASSARNRVQISGPDMPDDIQSRITPEDYHVPFRFTGDLKKLAIQLTDAPLTAEEQAEIERMRANIALSE